jgi:predicted MFS family arabinose efflux permease
MAVIVIVVALWKLKGEWTGEAVKMDSWGIVLCIFAQSLLLLGLTGLTKGLFYQVSFGGGILLLIVFFVYEKNKADPLVPIGRIIKNKTFSFSNLATLINYSATFALSYVLSLYLQTALGIDTATSGLILLVQPIIMAVLSPVAGALSDRIRPALLASLGMGISALGLFFFIFLTMQTPIALIILNLALIGLGFAMFAAPNTHVVMGSIDRPLYGVASSVLGNMRLIGQSVSMAIVSLITSFLIGELELGSTAYVDKLMVSLRIAFITFAVLCILGVFASLVRSKAASGGKA